MKNELANKSQDIVRQENKKSFQMKLSRLKEQHEEQESLEDETIEFLTSELILHGKDANQVRQISQISKVLGESLGLGSGYCDTLEKAAKVYDVGNIAISSAIYAKEDKLTYEEFVIIKDHTILGHDMLSNRGFESTDLAALISQEHHEWWNGSGYPARLKEDEINIASRIVSVADAVGALYRKRPGREVWDFQKILEHLKIRAGLQFDPDVIDVFLINKDIIHEILITELESAPSSWYM